MILTGKVGQSDLVYGESSSSGFIYECMQNYQSLCVVAVIYATLVNIQTQRQHFDQLILIAQPDELKQIIITLPFSQSRTTPRMHI